MPSIFSNQWLSATSKPQRLSVFVDTPLNQKCRVPQSSFTEVNNSIEGIKNIGVTFIFNFHAFIAATIRFLHTTSSWVMDCSLPLFVRCYSYSTNRKCAYTATLWASGHELPHSSYSEAIIEEVALSAFGMANHRLICVQCMHVFVYRVRVKRYEQTPSINMAQNGWVWCVESRMRLQPHIQITFWKYGMIALINTHFISS